MIPHGAPHEVQVVPRLHEEREQPTHEWIAHLTPPFGAKESPKTIGPQGLYRSPSRTLPRVIPHLRSVSCTPRPGLSHYLSATPRCQAEIRKPSAGMFAIAAARAG
jgi:hypothetical protein